jgi:hypothetical protein
VRASAFALNCAGLNRFANRSVWYRFEPRADTWAANRTSSWMA